MSEEDLISAFEFIGQNPSNKIIDKCLEICSTYGIDAEELVEYWSAFSMTVLKNTSLSLEGITLMEQRTLVNKKSVNTITKTQKENIPKKTTITQEPRIQSTVSNSPTVKDVPVPETSNTAEIIEDEETSQICYASRTNSGKVVVSFGKHHNYTTSEQVLSIKTYGNSDWYKPESFTALFTTQARIANTYERRVEEIGQIILNKNRLKVSNSEGDIVIYGRVRSEDRGKVNNKTIVLETPRAFDGPTNAVLNISNTQNYSIFSGQIIAARGITVSRNTFMVQEIYSDASADFTLDKPNFNDDIQIIVAAGPFTTPDNFSYEPLQDLLKQVVERKPNVLILIGPFIDITRPNLLSISETFEFHFEMLIKNIMECLVSWTIQVVLVPSLNDTHHHCPIFPTASYVLKQQYPNLICAPNPCLLDINGLIVGVTSLDILFQLTKEEVSRNSNIGDRMSRLASHLISQRSFCPLYPNRDPTASIDYEHLLNNCSMDVKPHLLILPSTLRYFIKNVSNCLVVNPERLMKNNVGGTYATINISALIKSGNVIDSISCEIKNI